MVVFLVTTMHCDPLGALNRTQYKQFLLDAGNLDVFRWDWFTNQLALGVFKLPWDLDKDMGVVEIVVVQHVKVL